MPRAIIIVAFVVVVKVCHPLFCGRRATPPGIQIRSITERHGGKGQASAKLRRTLQLRISVGFVGQPAATNAALEGDEDEE